MPTTPVARVTERPAGRDNSRPSLPAPGAVFTALAGLSDDAVISADVNGIIESWNAAAERIFGFRVEDAVGQSLRVLTPHDRHDEHDQMLARAARGESVSLREARRLNEHGDEVTVSLRLAPVRGERGAVAGVVLVAHDVNTRKMVEREAFRKGTIVGASSVARGVADQRRAVEELNEANRQKDEFLAVLSHELRTPLNAIMGWADLLVNTAMDALSQSRALASIQRNARVQAQLIEDLLDISRIVAGKLALTREHVDLGLVIDAALDDLRAELTAKQIDLHTGVDAQPSAVMGDAPRLQQVVSNLLSNAIKFTPRGGRIDVSLARLDADVQITVRDNGQGIAPEFIEHVFDRFRQGDSSATRRHGGLGLGLGIVKHLVEAHGGTVAVSSEGIGHGATFHARLPLHVAASASVRHTGERSGGAAPDLSEVRALVVDDDPDAAELLTFALERCGAQVITESSAAAALQAIISQPFDVLLADIGMPDIDGHDLIRAVRAHEQQDRTPPIAAVAITAHAGPGDRDRALKSGFNWHLTKPVDPNTVLRVVARMTKARK